MMEILKGWAVAVTPVVPYVFVALICFILFAVVYLFRAFEQNPEKTRMAVMLEIASLRKLRQVFTRRTDTIVTGEGEVIKPIGPNLGQTISRPIDPPVPPSSGAKP